MSKAKTAQRPAAEQQPGGIPAPAQVTARGVVNLHARETRRLQAARESIARMLGEKMDE